MKNFPNIISKLRDEPWLIIPAYHRTLQVAIDNGATSFHDVHEDNEVTEEPDQYGNQLVIPIFGPIGQHLTREEKEWFGACSLDDVSEQLDAAEEDDSVEEIILNFRSPGGTVTGIPELAARIAGIEKRVVAFTDSMMCSAAYYLGAGADAIYCTPSAHVGSIGVYAIYMDWSRMLDNEGIKMNPISAGRDKLMGAWFKPMTDEERAKLQAEVDKIYNRFKSHVSTNRTEVPDDAMQGNVYDGEDSVTNGLVDGLVDSLQDILR